MLQDFQGQTRMLRAQIGNLSAQNQELRRKYSTTDAALSEALGSRASLEVDMQGLQAQLHRAVVGSILCLFTQCSITAGLQHELTWLVRNVSIQALFMAVHDCCHTLSSLPTVIMR